MTASANYKAILDLYQKEENFFNAEIEACINQIRNKHRKSRNALGWILSEKSYRRIQKDKTGIEDEEENIALRYEVDTNGNFYVYIRQKTDYWENRKYFYTGGSWKILYSGAEAFQKTLLELDFDIRASTRFENMRWVERKETTTFEELKFTPKSIQITKKSDQKGYGLYCALKEITERSVKPLPVDPELREKEKLKHTKRSLPDILYSIAEFAAIMPTVVGFLLFAIYFIASIFSRSIKAKYEYMFIFLFVFYGLYMLPCMLFLNFTNALVRYDEADSAITLSTIVLIPIIAISINIFKYGIVSSTGADLFKLRTFVIIAILFVSDIMICRFIKKRRKQ